jgi:hypothetical protein
MNSRVTSARADAEHKANQVLQDQLQQMRTDIDKQVSSRAVDSEKERRTLEQKFAEAAKDRQKMAAMLSQLAKLPVPVVVTQPAATKENPNPAPIVSVPHADFPAVTAYTRECEQCKLELPVVRQDLADRLKQLDLANKQIAALKNENKTVLKESKGTFFSNLKKSVKWFAIGAVAGGAALCGTGHCAK